MAVIFPDSPCALKIIPLLFVVLFYFGLIKVEEHIMKKRT